MAASLFAPKCTLVPKNFFDPAHARDVLADVVALEDSEEVKYIEIDRYGAVLVYVDISGGEDSLPEMFHILEGLNACAEYNKILCSWHEGYLYLAIAQGKTLMLANTFKAQDFTTVEYYIFLAMKSLQLNPEVSTISWRTAVSVEDEVYLCHYFKAVEVLPCE